MKSKNKNTIKRKTSKRRQRKRTQKGGANCDPCGECEIVASRTDTSAGRQIEAIEKYELTKDGITYKPFSAQRVASSPGAKTISWDNILYSDDAVELFIDNLHLIKDTGRIIIPVNDGGNESIITLKQCKKAQCSPVLFFRHFAKCLARLKKLKLKINELNHVMEELQAVIATEKNRSTKEELQQDVRELQAHRMEIIRHALRSTDKKRRAKRRTRT